MKINRDYFASETGGPEFIMADHDITGFGPRLRLGANFPLSRRVSFFADGSASLIYGEEDQIYESDGATDRYDVTDANKLLPIFEANIGLEWRPASFRNHLAVRIGAEGQTWINGGGWEFIVDDAGADFADEFTWSLRNFTFSLAYEF